MRVSTALMLLDRITNIRKTCLVLGLAGGAGIFRESNWTPLFFCLSLASWPDSQSNLKQ